MQRLGQLSGKPATSGLHIHPVINAGRDRGGRDNEISVISSVQNRKLYSKFRQQQGAYNKPQTRRLEWHSDITFEPVGELMCPFFIFIFIFFFLSSFFSLT